MKDVLGANYACARDPRAAWIPVDVPACEVKGTLGANDQQVATVPVTALKDELAASLTRPVLLDVREEIELSGELGSLDKIIHIPIAELAHRLADLEGFRHQNIVTVCRSGGRAHTAAQILMQAGFGRVRVLNGGMVEWNKHGFPVRRAE
jgi:rhodanese-related sulfurtransferase